MIVVFRDIIFVLGGDNVVLFLCIFVMFVLVMIVKIILIINR